MLYRDRIRNLLTPLERRVFARLKSPREIQDYLDTLPVNFELNGETYMSPRRVLKHRTAHCFEGALVAAAACAFHGSEPLLLDLKTTHNDDDHVVTLFAIDGRWGALSKTNHSILRYRDPVYSSVRELAMSYFNEYAMSDGRKSMRAYSRPFKLSRFAPERWVTATEELDWLVEALDESQHFPIGSEKLMRGLRKIDQIEARVLELTEWNADGTKNRYRYS